MSTSRVLNVAVGHADTLLTDQLTPSCPGHRCGGGRNVHTSTYTHSDVTHVRSHGNRRCLQASGGALCAKVQHPLDIHGRVGLVAHDAYCGLISVKRGHAGRMFRRGCGSHVSFRAGKHVFIEKPMAQTLREADEIEAARLASGKLVFVGYMRRYATAFLRVKKIVQELDPAEINYGESHSTDSADAPSSHP
ncbi:Hypothetical Protein CGB_H0030C [Cryptococcus gattii WM276]|uniref:Gfo/Idh/MocA-like oxidoreductase N-terminal domain-containing protein n=1 Tax=Cryptococcus gattii serotype B (strain WM276 / ATCC MYA-4071) TaxID=367775 RepID=E6RA59_CRYGW|nr:Hypothetical Protein CGB_H0030C [Cryptococcus gattii WM276]ADV23793.1 Hypothetical Protein CGB_H0030C [Cryptococcus gattii WM276]